MRQLFPTTGDVDPIEAYGRLPAQSANRPAVRMNMISTVDGAASIVGRGRLGGPADRRVCEVLRTLADVILVGAGTVRDNHYGPARLDDAACALRQQWGLPPVPPIAVVTRSCHLDWRSSFFIGAQQRPIVITAAASSSSDRAQAATVADVITCGGSDVDFLDTLTALAERGCKNVLAEGGPGIAAQLAASLLLDEVCLAVSPILAAGSTGRIFAEGSPLIPPLAMTLTTVLEEEGYLFLRYRRP